MGGGDVEGEVGGTGMDWLVARKDKSVVPMEARLEGEARAIGRGI